MSEETTETTETTFAEDFRIDRANLDLELVKLPTLYKKWSDLEADAMREVDVLELEASRARTVRKRKYAELRNRICDEPGNFAIKGRVTNDAIESVITLHPEYITVQDAEHNAKLELANARHNYSKLGSAKWAMETKKKSLENLANLYLGNYSSNGLTNRMPAAHDNAQQHADALKNTRVVRDSE